MTLGETGQVFVTLAAAQTYASATRLDIEAARRELTCYLMEAVRVGDDTAPERWRRRSRTVGLDVGAHVAREGPLAVVVHLHVRDYR